MGLQWGQVRAAGIGEMLVSCRSLDEYRSMFALSDGDLRGRVLDCPGGAASFVAEARALGCSATACDPVYANVDPEALAEHARRETARGNAYIRAHPDEYAWTFFRDPDHHLTSRNAAADRFAADLLAHPDRYVAGALPRLPFPDDAFDLALSSHFLFSYADRFGYEFHLAGLRELARVAAQVRVYPLAPMGASEPMDLTSLRAALADEGIATEVRPVRYELQRCGGVMLVAVRQGTR